MARLSELSLDEINEIIKNEQPLWMLNSYDAIVFEPVSIVILTQFDIFVKVYCKEMPDFFNNIDDVYTTKEELIANLHEKNYKGMASITRKDNDNEVHYCLEASFNKNYEFCYGFLKLNATKYEIKTREELSYIVGDGMADELIIKAWENIAYAFENKTA